MTSKITLSVLGLLAMAVLNSSHGEARELTETSPITIGGDDKCDKSSIQISQDKTKLIGGIPVYSVEIANTCVDNGCIISNIHVNCGMFSSATLINPKIFRRLEDNDCLVSDGNPIGSGRVVSFNYANTFSYKLVLASAKVVCN